MPWVVCVTKPNQEQIAAVNLQRQGFSYYYPRYLYRKTLHDKPIPRPLFPRYMFVAVERLWRSLSGTRGISYLLMGDTTPQIIPDGVIDAIKAREDKRGLYQLEAPPKFYKGEKVKTNEGPWAGLPLIYEDMSSHERVTVLMNMMGRMVPVTLDEKLLVAA